MKKAISFVLAALMLVSAVPTTFATNDYTAGTKVEYTATGSESYTITVPAQLAPGGSGTVTLSGTWADNRVITVSAEPSVTLTNSINSADQKVLDVGFAGISEAGSNTGSQTFTESVSVADIQNALFGTWSGKFNYNVEVGAAVEMINFTINETTYQAEEGMTWGEWVASDYNTDGFRIGGGVIYDSGSGTVKPVEYEGVQPKVSDDELIKANTLYICNSGGGRV